MDGSLEINGIDQNLVLFVFQEIYLIKKTTFAFVLRPSLIVTSFIKWYYLLGAQNGAGVGQAGPAIINPL